MPFRFVLTKDETPLASAVVPDDTMQSLVAYAENAGTPLKDMLRYALQPLIRDAVNSEFGPAAVKEAKAAVQAAQVQLNELIEGLKIAEDTEAKL